MAFCAAPPLVAAPVTDTTTANTPATGNLLDSVSVPPGTTATVTNFTVGGSNTPIVPGTGPVPVTDPSTGLVTGTIEVLPDGSYTFTPAPGFSGPVPTVTAIVASSDGQSTQVPLSVIVDPMLRDGNEAVTVIAGTGPVNLNVLDNAAIPPGTTAIITGFSLPGSSVVYPASPTPVPVTDPTSGQVTGTVALQPDGKLTFAPAAGFIGQAPAITYTVASSDGQVSPGAAVITVLPGGGAS